MSKRLPKPLTAGTAAFPWPEPRRGEVDELVWDGLVYWCEPGSRPLFLDLHVPRRNGAGEPPALVLWLHGGGWWQGSRRRRPPGTHRHWLLERTLVAGFAVALVDYRLAPEGAFPAPIADVRTAIRWLRAHAEDLQIDATRVALWGESAGGHIACMAASCDRDLGNRGDGGENQDQSERVAAVVDWYGPTDLTALRKGDETAATLVDTALARSVWDDVAASPITYARKGLPAFLIAHGRGDAVIPVAQSRSYSGALRAAGVDVDYVETDGDHAFAGAHVMETVINRTLGFLGDRLGGSSRPVLDLPIAEFAGRPVVRPNPVASVADATVAGPAGDLQVRIQRPAVPTDVVVVYLDRGRGRGSVADEDAHQAAASRIAAAAPATVLQVDYRRPPEHLFLDGIDDAIAAVRWTADHLDDFGATRLVLAGDGVGGTIAAAAAVHCRDAGLELAGLLLLYPVTDWSRDESVGLVAKYLGGHHKVAARPRVSPARAHLHGLPPTILSVGALDDLFEDNLAFAYQLHEADVPLTLRIFPTLDHGFFSSATVSPAADRASKGLCRDLNRLLWDSYDQVRGG